MESAIVSIAIALCVFVGAVVIAALCVGFYRIYRSMSEVATGLKELNDSMKGVPAIMEGVRAICVELSASTVSVGSTVEKFRSTLFTESGARPARGRDSFVPYDEGNANREARIQEVMHERNLSRTQAADMIKSGLDYEEERFVVAGGYDE